MAYSYFAWPWRLEKSAYVKIEKLMIRTGLEVLLQHRKKLLANKRLGLVANPSSVDGELRFLVDLFLAEKSWKIVGLFGPEHGLRGEL